MASGNRVLPKRGTVLTALGFDIFPGGGWRVIERQ